ncbi:MAG: PaaI family thioesterase [Bacillota bacterium]
MKRAVRLEHCFGCGPKNPIGLKLEFWWEDREYVTSFTPHPEHQSYPGVVHGGLTATVLDETMGRMLFELYGGARTAELTVRYLAPVSPGQTTSCRAWIERQKGRAVFTGAVLAGGGTELARALGTYIIKGEIQDATE